jgi:hypothetical protein
VGEARLILRHAPAGVVAGFPSTGTAISLDAALRLRSVGNCGSTSGCLAVGSAQFADTGSDAYVSWGRWTGNSIAVNSSTPNTPLAANRSLHYLVGAPTVTMPTSGVFTYGLLGATSATVSDGSMAPGSFKGTAVVHFAPATQTRVGLEAQVTMSNGQYNFSTPGGLGNASRSGMAMDSRNTFSGELQTQPNAGSGSFNCGTGRCRVEVQGGFFGPDAARLGLGYSIVDPSNAGRSISGVGVLEKK